MNELVFQAQSLAKEGNLEGAYEFWVKIIEEYWHPDLYWLVERAAPVARAIGKHREFRQVYFRAKLEHIRFCKEHPFLFGRTNTKTLCNDTDAIKCPTTIHHIVLITCRNHLADILSAFKKYCNNTDIGLIIYIVDDFQANLPQEPDDNKICIIGIDRVYHDTQFPYNKVFANVLERYSYCFWKQNSCTDACLGSLVPYFCDYTHYRFQLSELLVVRQDYLSVFLARGLIPKVTHPLMLSLRDKNIENYPEYCARYGHFDMRLMACSYQFDFLKHIFHDWNMLVKKGDIYEQNWLDSIYIKYNLFDDTVKALDLLADTD